MGLYSWVCFAVLEYIIIAHTPLSYMVSEVTEHDWFVEMAMTNLQPPDPFWFKKTEEWLKWKCHFEQYRVELGSVDKDEDHQVSTLLYCLGEDAEDVLDTTRITGEDEEIQ